MKLYKFKTFTTSYYFPDVEKGKEWLYGLYSAYGGKLSRLYWSLFKNCGIIRSFTSVDSKVASFPFDTILSLAGKDSIMSFNMGSPGPLQKISILGYDQSTDEPFFAKYSDKSKAMSLTKNEIKLYLMLKDSGLVPQLFDYKDTEEFVWLKAEFIKGRRPKDSNVTNRILNICLKLKEYHLDDSYKVNENLNLQYECTENLKTCMSHGDFCPWNMLEDNGAIKLIDWEQAAERPLGFDLFTHICQVTNLVNPEVTLDAAINGYKTFIDSYFAECGVDNWRPYLLAFAKETKAFKEMKGSLDIAERYDCLL